MANNYRTKYNSKSKLKNYLFLGFLVLMVGVTTYFANFLIQRAQVFEVGAATGKANLFFEPTNLTLPPDGLVNLWATTDKQLGFVSAQISFDPTLIKLAQNPSLPNAALAEIIQLTDLAEANTTGKINIALAIKPTAVAIAPTGSFPLAGLKFSSKTTLANKTTTLSLSTTNLQLVDLGATPFTVTTQTATLTLNPTVTPSSTPTPTPTPSSKPTATPIANGSGPIIVVKSPVSGYKIPSSGVWIGSTQTDPDGISETRFLFDGKLVKTCKTESTCNYTYKGTISTGEHLITIESYDKSSAKNKSVVTVKVTK